MPDPELELEPESCRQDLLDALTLAVEAVHPSVVDTISQYIADPLTDDELADLMQALRADADSEESNSDDASDWAHDMTRPARLRLRHLVNKAKTRYATYLRATDKRDIRIIWPAEHSMQSVGMCTRRDAWIFLQAIWKRRYFQETDIIHNGACYKGFDVVVSNAEFSRVIELSATSTRAHCSENVLQTFGPLETGSKPRSLQDVQVQMVEALVDIHNNRFNVDSPPIERGNDTWYPFSNVVRKSHEHIAPPRFENLTGKKLDHLKSWDAGKPRDVIFRNSPRSLGRQVLGRRIQGEPRGKLPAHWRNEQEQRDDFFGGRLGERSARGAVRWPDLPPIEEHGRYNKAARPAPPKEFQMDALSDSGEDVGSVAVASLSTVAGDLQRMKSFVRRHSRADALQATPPTTEIDIPQAEPLPTPPSVGCSIPLSGRPPSATGLATPPESASPVKPRRLEIPNKRFNRRVPSAASKAKARRPTLRTQPPRDPLRCSSSNRVSDNSSTSASSRTASNSSMEVLSKVSTKSSSITAVVSSDSPSPTNLWSQPFENFKAPPMRKDSGLGTFSPPKQATTSVQHVDVIAQRTFSVTDSAVFSIPQDDSHNQAKEMILPEDHKRERLDSAISPAHRSAIEALRLSSTPRVVEVNGRESHGVFHRW